jgi:predicted nucleotidyltransferase component of viral defense system
MIPQRDISRISNQLFKEHGGRRVPESVIERDYCLAWFLSMLGQHDLRGALAFKGGTALRRCWFEDYRFSEDLDFSLVERITLEEILAGLKEIFAAMREASGIEMAYDRPDRHSHQNTHTFYLSYKGPLPAKNDVKVDITIDETFCFDLAERPILRTYEAFSDLPEGPTVLCYAIEEIFIEKLAALSDKARNEPRDLYDLSHLIDECDIRAGELINELNAKLGHRGRGAGGIPRAIAAKEKILATLWTRRLGEQISDLPEFGGVFRDVMRALREADLPES